MVYSGKYVMHMLLLNYLGGLKDKNKEDIGAAKNCIIGQESECKICTKREGEMKHEKKNWNLIVFCHNCRESVYISWHYLCKRVAFYIRGTDG